MVNWVLTLATIVDAVGIRKGDHFLYIGAGDGILVTAASVFYPDSFEVSVGVEIVPDLYERWLDFQSRLEGALGTEQSEQDNIQLHPQTSLRFVNCYEPDDELKEIFAKTTLVVCFATTWLHDIPG